MPVTIIGSRPEGYLARIGCLVREARRNRGWSRAQLATALDASEDTVRAIELGRDAPSLDVLARIGSALDSEIVTLGQRGPTHLRVTGGRRLSGSITVKSSKNAAVALLCAALLNRGSTTLRRVARIEEVSRILEVLASIGVRTSWLNDENDLLIVPPAELDLLGIDAEAARRTRSVLLLLGPLLHRQDRFLLPYAGGCDLGTRTVEPHLSALRRFGLDVVATGGWHHATVDRDLWPQRPVVLTERGDTVTENVLFAAARRPGVTVIRNASPNYMVQDVCCFLELLGVRIEGIGTTTLTVHGVPDIDRDVDYSPAEDPVEAMSLLTAAVVTGSEITVRRAPVEFLEIELALLEEMGLDVDRSAEYPAANGRTRLVDLTVHPGKLTAPADKVHPMPFPGLNIDNLPFFAVLAASAHGTTVLHDWVYDNRAIHLAELTKLGARVRLLDPHRLQIDGPTRWSGAEVVCPPALRPAVVVLLGMLAARGTSVLRNVYVIDRGYEQLAQRLNGLGARIETFRDA